LLKASSVLADSCIMEYFKTLSAICTGPPPANRIQKQKSKHGLDLALQLRSSFVSEETAGDSAKEEIKREGIKQQMVRVSYEIRGKSNSIHDFYEKVCKLGEGAYAEVGLADDQSKKSIEGEQSPKPVPQTPGQKYVAVKEIRWKGVWGRWFRDRKQEDVVRAELEVLMMLDHPYIINMKEWFEDPRKGIFFVMEFCAGDTFQALLEHVSTIPEEVDRMLYRPRFAASIIQIVYGLAYIHNLAVPYVHRDLKPDNVLFTHDPLDSRCVAKLADFGITKTDRCSFTYEAAFQGQRSGTFLFMAPEFLTEAAGNFSPEMDMWAVGVMFVWCITCLQRGKLLHPMLGENDGEGWDANQQRIFQAYFREEHWNHSLFLGEHEPVIKLADKLLTYVNLKEFPRITAVQFLNDEWTKKEESKGDVKDLSRWKKEVTQNFSSYMSLNKFDRLILSLMAEYSDTDQKNELEQLFKDMDQAKSGSISKDELEDHFRAHSSTTVNLEAVFKSMDFTGDGKIEYSDWLAAAIGDSFLQQADAIETAFNYLDFENSGRISRKALEFAIGVEDTKAVLAQQRWLSFGSDGLSRSDFRKVVTEIAQKRAKVLIQDDDVHEKALVKSHRRASNRSLRSRSLAASSVSSGGQFSKQVSPDESIPEEAPEQLSATEQLPADQA